MQNTSCCRSCDDENRTREICVLGKTIRVKDYICSEDGVQYKKKPEHIQLLLSVSPTAYCPGACAFCVAQDTKAKRQLDIEKFAAAMRLLQAENRVRCVKITGGEPFWDVGLLNEVVSVLFETFGYALALTISTNGCRLDQLHRLRDLEHIEAIHLSRHHYDDAINRTLFGCADVPSGDAIRDVISGVFFKDLIVLNCLLLKDYIGTAQQAHRFMDFAIGIGAAKVGFVTCAPVNAFAAAQTVPFEDVIRQDDPALLFTRGFHDYEFCHCRDGIYASDDGRILEFYGRTTKMDGCRYARAFVYEADDHLRTGFGGEVIL